MQNDEQEIRELVSTWLVATKAGDTETVLDLMADDVVFLVPGEPPMVGKTPYIEAAQPYPDQLVPDIDGTSEIQEIKILGDWAFMWSEMVVTITPTAGAPVKRMGHTLSILHKEDGKWRIAREANMLVPVTVEETESYSLGPAALS
ncbi:YybH family protein [Gimesia fumaroli]|uniref:SnoaL-like domain protein n=1 Tax=Gimesia fumaroli TaxID=2527976 RepID=A0A518IFB7_9PLAN|nr:SgcJ/EcaC family oxidoreductase [Gimesia fumaroli]QDV51791.1 SnoaL-like domain protein [Gimesia fumaroli]